MPDQDLTPLPGSERGAPSDPRVGDVDPDEQVTVTVYLRAGGAMPSPDGPRMTREQWADAVAPSSADLDRLRRLCAEHALTLGELDRGRRAVAVTGAASDLAAAFGTALGQYRSADGTTYRGRSGPLQLPADLHGAVEAVVGLDNRRQSRNKFRVATSVDVSYSTVQVAEAYQFPTSATGVGETVGLIELGGGYETTDLSTYFSGLGLSTPTVTAVSVDGGTNSPGGGVDSDGEVMLDIEMVGSVAPGAALAVYFAPNTDQGFLDAVTTAVHDTTNHPSVVSISWGGAESTWTAQAMQQMASAISAAATLGVTVCVAAGDGGSTDGQTDGEQHVDFPASAPYSLACGGTTLQLDTATTPPTITSEVVWNDLAAGDGATGGGISAEFPVPSYQSGVTPPASANAGAGPGRGVPDVAGNADPATGYNVLVDGTATVIGGTSAVAPLWSGLIARFNQALGTPVGFFQPTLYPLGETAPAGGAVVNDITSGNNGAYQAGPGWDACTGWGSPRGTALLAALAPAGTSTGTGGVSSSSL